MALADSKHLLHWRVNWIEALTTRLRTTPHFGMSNTLHTSTSAPEHARKPRTGDAHPSAPAFGARYPACTLTLIRNERNVTCWALEAKQIHGIRQPQGHHGLLIYFKITSRHRTTTYHHIASINWAREEGMQIKVLELDSQQ